MSSDPARDRLAAALHEHLAPHPALGDEVRRDGACRPCWLLAPRLIEALLDELGLDQIPTASGDSSTSTGDPRA